MSEDNERNRVESGDRNDTVGYNDPVLTINIFIQFLRSQRACHFRQRNLSRTVQSSLLVSFRQYNHTTLKRNESVAAVKN